MVRGANILFLPLASAAGVMFPPVMQRGSREKRETQFCSGQDRVEKNGEREDQEGKEVTQVITGDQTSPLPYYHHLLPPVT